MGRDTPFNSLALSLWARSCTAATLLARAAPCVCVSECVCVAENTQAGPRPCRTTFPSAHTQSAFTGLTLPVLGTVTAGSAGSYT